MKLQEFPTSPSNNLQSPPDGLQVQFNLQNSGPSHVPPQQHGVYSLQQPTSSVGLLQQEHGYPGQQQVIENSKISTHVEICAGYRL